MPTCTKCQEEKDPNQFYARCDSKTGIRPQCKACTDIQK